MLWLKELCERVILGVGGATRVGEVCRAEVSCRDREFVVWTLETVVDRIARSGDGIEENVRGPWVSGTLRRQVDGQVESARLLLSWEEGVFACKRLWVQIHRKDGKLFLDVYKYELSLSTLFEWRRGEISLGEGLVLRVMPATPELAQVVHTAIQCNSIHLGRYLSGLVADCRSVEGTRWLLSRWYHDYITGNGVHLGLFDGSGTFLGVSEVDRRPFLEDVVGVVEYWLTRDACGRGLAQRIFQASMKYSVQELGVTSFYLDIHPDNKASAVTAVRSGGRQRKSRKEPRGRGGGRYAVMSSQTFDVYEVGARRMEPVCGSVEGRRREWMGEWTEKRVAMEKRKLVELKDEALRIAGELSKVIVSLCRGLAPPLSSRLDDSSMKCLDLSRMTSPGSPDYLDCIVQGERDFDSYNVSPDDDRLRKAREFMRERKEIERKREELLSVGWLEPVEYVIRGGRYSRESPVMRRLLGG
ncbi:hypothetical protein Pmar_PMAR012834 [Perkinsus marinus ATCC 50983]|uniref:N-acetyltransferase domain-containing protein n=1 Tax=Perkinsus marinus (strain ATCC 50983 / TXsc) TaxID=423536 RepID=C5L5J1_PERM5|nr:hypothetical protein Pmar_PMAR012834 [Perkinsus marinus ATCC 50983]EER08016.1 hypothetical protein Pmar_PMAR012834 [Perkinsus marinus ATCC 50983]|eukprot:XP_002776200.1 hypothetical protein Pmar_PMAR012834 [Perkinsus marinus ATCC 50983]